MAEVGGKLLRVWPLELMKIDYIESGTTPNTNPTTGEHTKNMKEWEGKFSSELATRLAPVGTLQFLHVSARLSFFGSGRHSSKKLEWARSRLNSKDQSNDEESCKEDHNEGSTSERMRRAPMATPRWIILSEQKLLLEEFFKAVP